MIVQSHNPRTKKVDAGEPEIQGTLNYSQPGLSYSWSQK